MSTVERKLNATDVKYGIICAGSSFEVPLDISVTVKMDGRSYEAKMNSKTKGRIDGLTALYKGNELCEGDVLELFYHCMSDTIFIEKKNSEGNVEENEHIMQEDSNIIVPENDEEDLLLDVEPDIIDFDSKSDIKEEAQEKPAPKGEYIKFANMASRDAAWEAFRKCDSVVFHREYYNRMNYGQHPEHMAVSHSIVMKIQYNPEENIDVCELYNEVGEKLSTFTIDLHLKKNEYESFLGINNRGIWFQVSTIGKGSWNHCERTSRIICLDVYNDSVDNYITKSNKKNVRDIYIDGTLVVYVCEISEDRQELMCFEGCGEEPEKIFTAYKGQSISKLSACVNVDKVAFHLYDKNDKKTGWKILDVTQFPFVFETALVEPVDEKGCNLIEIHMVDLKSNIMCTSVTEKEKIQFSLMDGVWAVRKLGNPVEGELLTYKKSGKPAVWYGIPKFGRDEMYFDLINCYYPCGYTTLNSIDRQGNLQYVGNTNHGECGKFLVSDNYVFVNYDAYDLVRLPRNYNTHDGRSENNPEAVPIFGKGVDFRM